MSHNSRQASGGSSKTKRRLIDAEEDGAQISADDQPKRQRVSRACDSCRSKKDKCDGVQPVCSTCASLCRPCTYKANPKKRGLPTGYLRTLELLWGLVFCKIQGSEEVVRSLLKAANIPSHLAIMGKEAEGSDMLVSSWKNSIVLKEIERMLATLDRPEEDHDKPSRAPGESESPQEAVGSNMLSLNALEWHIPEGLIDAEENSLTAGLSPVKTPTTGSNGKNQPTRFTRDSGTQTSLPINQGQEVHDTILNPSSHSLHLPSNAWPLLDIYFAYTQCWFPILEKHDLLRTAFRQAEDDVDISPLSPGSGDHAALWAVLTLASIQEASITTTCQLPDLTTDRSNHNYLYATAKSLIPAENGIHEIGHVQALLVLSLVKLGQQEWTAAWILVGQAICIARHLRMDHSFTTSARSRHVFLGCFVLETLLAMKTDQVPLLRKEDVAKIGPINEDGLEEWHPWEDQTGLRSVEPSRGSFRRGPLHALSTFNRLISLMCILNEMCCLKRTQTNFIPQLEALECQLQHWVSSLPKSYRVDLQRDAGRLTSPPIFGLEMMYESIVTALCRQFSILESKRNIPGTSHQKRAADSSIRLLSLLQTYMETYSLPATCPTFGMILTFGIPEPGERTNTPLSFELEHGLKSKLQSFSSHLATVWCVQNKVTMEAGFAGRTPDAALPMLTAVDRQRSFPSIDPVSQNTLLENGATPSSSSHPSLHPSRSDSRQNRVVDDARTGLSALGSFLSNSLVRTGPHIEENAALSFPTPSPSLNFNQGAAEMSQLSHQASQLKSPASHRQQSSISSTTRLMDRTNVVPDLTSPFRPETPQYQQTYSDPNMNLGSFVDIGYGPIGQPRIAPDLDALFDELASLDGTEKLDNQPEFMQNLGFVSDTGIPELYSYSEPFLLAQAQQLPEATGIGEGNSNHKR